MIMKADAVSIPYSFRLEKWMRIDSEAFTIVCFFFFFENCNWMFVADDAVKLQ